MDQRVSAVASLVAVTAFLGGCGQAAGKAELTEVCLDKFGGKTEMCNCFVNNLEASLNEAQFAELSQAVYDNRRFSGDWIPGTIRTQPEFRMVIGDANTACLSPG